MNNMLKPNPYLVNRQEHRNSIRNKIIGLLVIVATALCIIAVATSSADSNQICSPPENIARYRAIGVGAGYVFSRILAYKHDVDPLATEPDPLTVIEQLSDVVVASDPPEGKKASALAWAWLQFLEQDISRFEDTGMPPRDDYLLDSHGNRQDINFASPYIDASQIYGNSDDEAFAIRRMDGTGKLKTSYNSGSLPLNDSEMPDTVNGTTFLFLDDRHSANSLVDALYVLFIREHNYWCDRLNDEHPMWLEFEYYNTARALVIAEIQAITYRAFIPVFVDKIVEREIRCFGGMERISPAFTVDDFVQKVSVFNEVATSVFPLYTTLGTPSIMTDVDAYIWTNGIANVLSNASFTPAQRRDGYILDQYENEAAMAIDKERDHQIPPYTSYHYHYMKRDGPRVPCLAYVRQESNKEAVCSAISTIFGEERVDLFTGMLIERRALHHEHAVFGEVARQLLSDQFTHLKHNDHYFYLWYDTVEPWLSEIHHSTLSTIVARNTGFPFDQLHHNLFVLPAETV